MDKLKEIIHTLSEEDQKEFKAFIHRLKKKDKRKDLKLFQLLQSKQELETPEIIKKLYASPNRDAYHALRKRLMRHLTDFIVTKRLEEDTTAAATVMGLLSLSRYLFEKKSDQMAWSYLKKAEQLAEQNDQYELLNNIYSLQIEHADTRYSDDLQTIIQKRKANRLLVDEDEQANEANSLIKQQLQQVRLEGKAIEFEKITNKILKAYGLNEIMTKRPKLLFNLLSITRSVVLAKRDFYIFEPFIIEQYERIDKGPGFSRKDHYYKVNMLYMIAHVLYRNRKFKEAKRYLDIFHENILAFNKSYFQQFYPKYLLLLAAVNTFSGNNEKAIALLEGALKDRQLKPPQSELLNIEVNLSVYHFNQGHFAAANDVMLNIYHTDKWCEKVMGREWVLKKNIIEALIQYELGNEEIVLYRIRSIERNFKPLFKQARYQRAKVFLGFVRQLVQKPFNVTEPAFAEKVAGSFEFLPTEQEDIQAMSFYAWLKSKMLREAYYETLLELVNR